MAENNLVARIERDDLRLSIYWDEYPDNPRNWDNLGTMICFHRNYYLGDVEESKRYGGPRDFLESLAEQLLPDGNRYYYDEEDDEIDRLEGMSMEELLDLVKTKNVILPLFIYDHGGVTMNTSGYSCPWDSGQVGWIYISHDIINKEYGRPIDEETIKLVTEVLEAEVKLYDYYLTGSIYGYVIDEKKTCSECGHIIYDELDSCWGFYGENVKREMKENVEERVEFLFDLIDWY